MVKMADPDSKIKHRQRRLKVRSKIAQSLEDRKYHQRVKESRKKEAKDLSFRELVELINDKDQDV